MKTFGGDFNKFLNKIRSGIKKKAPLETFKFKKLTAGEQWVHISTPEFTAICPFSDFPDFGTIEISYDRTKSV